MNDEELYVELYRQIEELDGDGMLVVPDGVDDEQYERVCARITDELKDSIQ